MTAVLPSPLPLGPGAHLLEWGAPEASLTPPEDRGGSTTDASCGPSVCVTYLIQFVSTAASQMGFIIPVFQMGTFGYGHKLMMTQGLEPRVSGSKAGRLSLSRSLVLFPEPAVSARGDPHEVRRRRRQTLPSHTVLFILGTGKRACVAQPSRISSPLSHGAIGGGGGQSPSRRFQPHLRELTWCVGLRLGP